MRGKWSDGGSLFYFLPGTGQSPGNSTREAEPSRERRKIAFFGNLSGTVGGGDTFPKGVTSSRNESQLGEKGV